jgi:hypothetical protein
MTTRKEAIAKLTEDGLPKWGSIEREILFGLVYGHSPFRDVSNENERDETMTTPLTDPGNVQFEVVADGDTELERAANFQTVVAGLLIDAGFTTVTIEPDEFSVYDSNGTYVMTVKLTCYE